MTATSRGDVAHHCQLLKEASRPVDRKIGIAIGAFARRRNSRYGGRIDYVDVRTEGHETWPGHGGDDLVPCYTYSFDDAMSLVVENYYVVAIHEDPHTGLWSVMLGARGRNDKPTIHAEGKHLPAVLCAAWLLAGAA